MGTLNIRWSRFVVEKKHDLIDKDQPYLWVFGLLVDLTRAAAILSRPTINGPAGSSVQQVPVGPPVKCVIRCASRWPNLGQPEPGRDTFKKGESVPVAPQLDIVDLETGTPYFVGVAVVAMERGKTGVDTQQRAYDEAADYLDRFIDYTVRETLGSDTTEVNLSRRDKAALSRALEAQVKPIFAKSSLFLSDHRIGDVQFIPSLEDSEDIDEAMDFVFDNGGTRYRLNGHFSYRR